MESTFGFTAYLHQICMFFLLSATCRNRFFSRSCKETFLSFSVIINSCFCPRSYGFSSFQSITRREICCLVHFALFLLVLSPFEFWYFVVNCLLAGVYLRCIFSLFGISIFRYPCLAIALFILTIEQFWLVTHHFGIFFDLGFRLPAFVLHFRSSSDMEIIKAIHSYTVNCTLYKTGLV